MVGKEHRERLKKSLPDDERGRLRQRVADGGREGLCSLALLMWRPQETTGTQAPGWSPVERVACRFLFHLLYSAEGGSRRCRGHEAGGRRRRC